MVLEPDQNAVQCESTSGVGKYKYTFRPTVDSFSKGSLENQSSLLNSQISVGDPIVISDESGHYARAVGFILELTMASVVVAVDRKLAATTTGSTAKIFRDVANQTNAGGVAAAAKDRKALRYRIDKDELTSGMGMIRNNLVKLLKCGDGDKLRRLLIHLDPPTFHKTLDEQQKAVVQTALGEAHLNSDQRNAVDQVLTGMSRRVSSHRCLMRHLQRSDALLANDYTLILGMPGTGKTTTLAHIVKALASLGKSVLLTSYTHSAVDNILLKLKTENVPFLRLGNSDKVECLEDSNGRLVLNGLRLLQLHPEIRQMMAAKPSTLESLQKAYDESLIVATTCLGVNQ
jgi:DNA replication ATP-dependent helicase Dna2